MEEKTLEDLVKEVDEMKTRQDALEKENEQLKIEKENAQKEVLQLKLASTNKPVVTTQEPEEVEFEFDTKSYRKERKE